MAKQLSQKYPDYVFIKISTNSKDIKIKKEKYMIPRDVTIHQFLNSLRNDRMVALHPNKALTLFVGNNIPRLTDFLGTIYERYKKDDGILYVKIETENVFG